MVLPLFPEALAAEVLEVEAHYEGPSQESGAPMEVDAAAGGGSSDSGSDDDEAELVRHEDEAEELRINTFTAETCCCHFGPKSTACSTRFDRELIPTTRMNCREMTKAQLDVVILANLEAYQHDLGSSRSHIDYYFHGRKVCKSTFLFLHAVGSKHFKNLVAHFTENGLTLRVHGNTKRLPANTVPFSDTQNIVHFISNFAAIHALPLPGRIPGQYSDEKALLRPIDMTKRYVYRQYCMASTEKPISRRKFETLWLQLLPHISVMKPATDLCETCHLNITKKDITFL